MSIKGVDFYSLSLSDIKSTDARFVVRYLSNVPGKNLLRSEADMYAEANLDIVCIWESSGKRALDGEAAGIEDAHQANANALAAGMPGHKPIYFGVDFDTTNNVADIESYFKGVSSILGAKRTGAYGGITTIKYLFDEHLIEWGWQTSAWSYGKWDPRAQFRQVVYTTHGYDEDEAVVDDYGQWRPVLKMGIDLDLMKRLNLCYSKANAIIGPGPPYKKTPYKYSGGHNPQFAPSLAYSEGINAPGAGYDCSSFGSTVLRAGGLLAIPKAPYPLDTGDFMTWGLPGPGQYLSVVVRNDSEVQHMRLDFHSNPKWTNRYCEAPHTGEYCWWVTLGPTDLEGYIYRHWPNT